MTNTRKIYLNTNNDKLASQSSVRSGLVLPFENVDVLLVDEHDEHDDDHDEHDHQSGLVLPFENVDVLVVDEHLLPLGTKQL